MKNLRKYLNLKENLKIFLEYGHLDYKYDTSITQNNEKETNSKSNK